MGVTEHFTVVTARVCVVVPSDEFTTREVEDMHLAELLAHAHAGQLQYRVLEKGVEVYGMSDMPELILDREDAV